MSENWENECRHGRSLGGWCPQCGGIVHAVDLAGEDPDNPTEQEDAPDASELLAMLLQVEWVNYNDPDHGEQTFCQVCRYDKKHGHHDECELGALLKKVRAS